MQKPTQVLLSLSSEDNMEAFYASVEAERNYLSYQPNNVYVRTKATSLKLKSAAAGLSKAKEAKVDLRANVKEFREVEMEEKAEKYLRDQLACLQERKRKLEEEFSAKTVDPRALTTFQEKCEKAFRNVNSLTRLFNAWCFGVQASLEMPQYLQ
ncbi:hypothetical protein RIF29_37819 [Crotalaria pallida]|uniref:Uncharacterized protein n=1 Tax=Crotalaria pallida TaxID=3830 RepID=A0AAN9DYU6_CROPI